MVESQLRARNIRDERILEAFLQVPRHEFVDTALAAEAYSDRALPIGHGQTISQPYMVGIMTSFLAPKPTDRVLEVGTGSGFQAAILSRLVHTVFSVERIASLAQRAQKNFAARGITNIIQRVGDGSLGWKAYAPFDGIIVTAGAPAIPGPLQDQLADGGRLVVPTGSRGGQILSIVTREGDRFASRSEVPCIFVPLLGEEGWNRG
jgi:protein-L-isoaspartate(D-aspartate) O-methyltransferase